MPEIFDKQITKREGSPEHIEMLRAAYVSALSALDLAHGSPGDRLILVEIVQEIGSMEVFREADHIAKLAVDLFRARRG